MLKLITFVCAMCFFNMPSYAFTWPQYPNIDNRLHSDRLFVEKNGVKRHVQLSPNNSILDNKIVSFVSEVINTEQAVMVTTGKEKHLIVSSGGMASTYRDGAVNANKLESVIICGATNRWCTEYLYNWLLGYGSKMYVVHEYARSKLETRSQSWNDGKTWTKISYKHTKDGHVETEYRKRVDSESLFMYSITPYDHNFTKQGKQTIFDEDGSLDSVRLYSGGKFSYDISMKKWAYKIGGRTVNVKALSQIEDGLCVTRELNNNNSVIPEISATGRILEVKAVQLYSCSYDLADMLQQLVSE